MLSVTTEQLLAANKEDAINLVIKGLQEGIAQDGTHEKLPPACITLIGEGAPASIGFLPGEVANPLYAVGIISQIMADIRDKKRFVSIIFGRFNKNDLPEEIRATIQTATEVAMGLVISVTDLDGTSRGEVREMIFGEDGKFVKFGEHDVASPTNKENLKMPVAFLAPVLDFLNRQAQEGPPRTLH